MWKNVIFSDESQFHQVQATAKYVRRPKNERFNQKYTIPTVRHSPSVMVWGSFSGQGAGNLYFLPPNTTFKADNYLTMLKKELPAVMHRLNGTFFQQDNAPCHKAKLVMTWLRERDFGLLDWPAQSPDLNPIENLWNIMKRRVAVKHPSNVDHLKEIIQQVWNETLSPDQCFKLATSMPRRIQAVLKNKGGHTKY
jgi:transposase